MFIEQFIMLRTYSLLLPSFYPQLHIGNVYEAGKLNLLTVIQLLNEVLKIMKYECCQADQAKLTMDLRFLEKEAKLQRERLLDLQHMRYTSKIPLLQQVKSRMVSSTKNHQHNSCSLTTLQLWQTSVNILLVLKNLSLVFRETHEVERKINVIFFMSGMYNLL